MDNVRERIRIASRKLLPNRNWGPIDAWIDPRYDAAFRRNKATANDLKAQRIALSETDLQRAPSFSIVTPLFNTPEAYLNDLVDSVLAQSYPKIELVLVNASPESDILCKRVRAFAESDERIKVITLEKNLGITENTNRGVAEATGDYVSFVDHDDWIEPDAFYEYALAIMADKSIDLLYCDEDLVERTKSGWHHVHPFFKASYSPEHLLCTNYIIHLLTVRRSLIGSLSVADSRFDGSQDYNLVLKATERSEHVHHVPKVLYHWRIGENSTADNTADKPYAKRANRIAIQEHLGRTNSDATIIGSGLVSVHNIWFRPSNNDKVSIVVDARKGSGSFIEAFQQVNTYANYEIVLVGDGGNHNADAKVLHVGVRPDTALFTALNEGARHATGDVIAFFSPDCQLCSPEPLEQTLGMLERDGVGIVGPRTLFADMTVKSFGVGVTAQAIMPFYRGYERTDPGYHCNNRVFKNVSAVSWQGLSLKKELFGKLGGFDESFRNEIGAADLCRRARALGRRVVASCTIELTTEEWPASRRFDYRVNRPDYCEEDTVRFYEKWPEMLNAHDPYWSPHLDQMTGYPSIAEEFLNE